MFSLIITIISIALVAALALATIYYGGTAFNKGSAEAKASQLINEGQQINGAAAMARADVANGTLAAAPTDLAGLVTATYLAQAPADWVAASVAAGASATVAVSSLDVCKAVNAKAGLGSVDQSAATAGKVFQCVTTAGVHTVSYAL